MPKEDNNLSEVREKHLERIIGLYETRSKEFQRVFNGLVLFSLVFLFIILIPYASLKIEGRQISEEMQNLLVEIKPMQARFLAYEQAQAGIEDLRQQINNGPDELREHIKTLEEECASTSIFAQQPVCPSDNAERDSWLNQKVQEEIQNQLAAYQEIITKDVIAPLQTIDVSATDIDLAALTEGLDSLQIIYPSKLAENPNFWRKFESKVSFYAQLDEALDGKWSTYESVIEAQSKILDDALTSLEATLVGQTERQDQLKTDEVAIEGRLSQIEFPFGKFPVALNEAVAIFPLVLSLGFFICTSQLFETMRARRSFHLLYQDNDPNREILTDQQIALIAPLPIDPLDREKNPAIQSAILLVPFVIFLVSCGLILYGWTLQDNLSDILIFTRWVYAILYVFSLGLFVYGYQRVIKEARHYSIAK